MGTFKKNVMSHTKIDFTITHLIATGRDLAKTHFFCNGAAECRIVMQCTASSAIMASGFLFSMMKYY